MSVNSQVLKSELSTEYQQLEIQYNVNHSQMQVQVDKDINISKRGVTKAAWYES